MITPPRDNAPRHDAASSVPLLIQLQHAAKCLLAALSTLNCCDGCHGKTDHGEYTETDHQTSDPDRDQPERLSAVKANPCGDAWSAASDRTDPVTPEMYCAGTGPYNLDDLEAVPGGRGAPRSRAPVESALSESAPMAPFRGNPTAVGVPECHGSNTADHLGTKLVVPDRTEGTPCATAAETEAMEDHAHEVRRMTRDINQVWSEWRQRMEDGCAAMSQDGKKVMGVVIECCASVTRLRAVDLRLSENSGDLLHATCPELNAEIERLKGDLDTVTRQLTNGPGVKD